MQHAFFLSTFKLGCIYLLTHVRGLCRSGGHPPQCSVCICDYEDGEVIRTLPCAHEFHLKCIDAWLSSHITCPNCREEVAPAPPSPVAPPPGRQVSQILKLDFCESNFVLVCLVEPLLYPMAYSTYTGTSSCRQ